MTLYHCLKLHYLHGDGITTIVRKINSINGINSKILPIDTDSKERLEEEFKNSKIFPHFFEKNTYVIHNIFNMRIIIFSYLMLILGRDLLFFPHSSLQKSAFSKSKFRKILFYNTVLRPILSLSKGIIFLCENEKRTSIYPNKVNTFIIPNGVLIPEIDIMKNKNDRHKILFMGRYDIFHKGIDILLKEYKNYSLDAKEYSIPLDFYGSGDKEKIENICTDLNLQKFITVNDPVFGNDKEFLLKEYSIFILTSRYEGIPVALLEAMSFGCIPVITIDTNMADIITEYNCGFILSEDMSLKEILNKLQLMNKEEIIYMRNRCVQAIKDKHDWFKISNDYINLFKKETLC